jgi:hypothetical protein
VHLFHLSLGFLVEAQPRTRHFLAEVHIKFFRRPHVIQNKTKKINKNKCLLNEISLWFRNNNNTNKKICRLVQRKKTRKNSV